MVREKLEAVAAQVLVVTVVVFVSVMCGQFFEMTFSTANIATTTVAVALLALDFGFVAMAIGAGTGNRGLAVGVTTAAAAASYLVSSLAPVVSALEPFRFISLFYWAVGNGQLEHGLGLGSLAVLVGAGVAAAIAVVWLFDRHDLRA